MDTFKTHHGATNCSITQSQMGCICRSSYLTIEMPLNSPTYNWDSFKLGAKILFPPLCLYHTLALGDGMHVTQSKQRCDKPLTFKFTGKDSFGKWMKSTRVELTSAANPIKASNWFNDWCWNKRWGAQFWNIRWVVTEVGSNGRSTVHRLECKGRVHILFFHIFFACLHFDLLLMAFELVCVQFWVFCCSCWECNCTEVKTCEAKNVNFHLCKN